MRHDVVSSENTGRGHRYPNVPAPMMEGPATLMIYETKKAGRETRYAASFGVIRVVKRQESAEVIVAQHRE